MGKQKLLRYLQADAEFYGLDALASVAKKRLENPIACKSKTEPEMERAEYREIAAKRNHELQVAQLGKDAQVFAALTAREINPWQARQLGILP